MRIIRIKNNQESADIYCGKTIEAGEYYQIQSESELLMFQSDIKVNQDLWTQLLIVNNGISDLSPFNGSNWLTGSYLAITETTPFAAPTYRTKNTALAEIGEVSADSSTNFDYCITEERYVSGGEITAQNSEFGDYVEAHVMDLDGVIPEAYRSALCENYPIVATYIEKHWLNKNGECICNTYPLNAKITAGLYLRVIYHATSAGTTRQVAISYSMQKKL